MMEHHSISDSALDALVDRVFSGEASPEEHAALDTWVAGGPGRGARLQLWRDAWETLAYVDVNPDAAREELRRRIGQGEIAESRVSDWDGGSRGRSQGVGLLGRWPLREGAHLPAWMTRFALSVCAIMAIAFGVWRSRSDGMKLPAHYATGTGERTQVTLPDGSRITMAPESRLSYATDARGARTVTLVGHAYFLVTHDARHPFTVHTGRVHTRVLGTAFDVQHYGDDSIVRIRVTDGKVASRGRGGRSAPVLLVAGTEGRLTDSTALIVTNSKTDNSDAWTRGLLVFDETPVSDMLRTLQRWYGYEFRLADSALARRQVSTTFAIGDTVNTMADLKMLLDVTLRFDGSVVTLSPAHRRKVVGPKYYRWPPVIPSQSEVGK